MFILGLIIFIIGLLFDIYYMIKLALSKFSDMEAATKMLCAVVVLNIGNLIIRLSV